MRALPLLLLLLSACHFGVPTQSGLRIYDLKPCTVREDPALVDSIWRTVVQAARDEGIWLRDSDKPKLCFMDVESFACGAVKAKGCTEWSGTISIARRRPEWCSVLVHEFTMWLAMSRATSMSADEKTAVASPEYQHITTQAREAACPQTLVTAGRQ